jgi:hypothetical protein
MCEAWNPPVPISTENMLRLCRHQKNLRSLYINVKSEMQPKKFTDRENRIFEEMKDLVQLQVKFRRETWQAAARLAQGVLGAKPGILRLSLDFPYRSLEQMGMWAKASLSVGLMSTIMLNLISSTRLAAGSSLTHLALTNASLMEIPDTDCNEPHINLPQLEELRLTRCVGTDKLFKSLIAQQHALDRSLNLRVFSASHIEIGDIK